MGYSRDSFYHFKMRYENSGEQALPEISRKKSIQHVECSMTDLTIGNPALGQLRASQELLPQGIVSRVVGGDQFGCVATLRLWISALKS